MELPKSEIFKLYWNNLGEGRSLEIIADCHGLVVATFYKPSGYLWHYKTHLGMPHKWLVELSRLLRVLNGEG